MRERVAHAVRARVAERTFSLQAQAGQRRAQLVCGIGNETLLQFEQFAQAREQGVDGLRQRADFQRHAALVERRQVARLALRQLFDQRIEQVQAAADADPHQHQHDRDQQQHDRQGTDEDLACECVAAGKRFGDGHDDGVAAVVSAQCQRRDAQRAAVPVERIEARRGVDDRQWGAGRQVDVGCEHAVLEAAHGVESRLGRFVLHQDAHLRAEFLMPGFAADHPFQRAHAIHQRAVVVDVRVVQGEYVDEHAAAEPGERHRHDQNRKQASTQARRSHRPLPANNRGRARFGCARHCRRVCGAGGRPRCRDRCR